MSVEHTDSARSDAGPSRQASSQPGSLRNVMGGTGPEDLEHFSSVSQKSSPRLTSILLSPSEKTGTRPRSSEGRVTSLNLPKHPHPSRQTINHPSAFGPSRRRAVPQSNVGQNDKSLKENWSGSGQVNDGFFNFGVEDEFPSEPEDSHVLEDVQRALKSKALREARARSGTSTPVPESSSSSPPQFASSIPRLREDIVNLAPVSETSPKSSFTPTPSLSPTAPPKVAFPPYVQSISRSLESNSSEGRLDRSIVPVLLSFKDGSTYLDWSGTPLETNAPEREKSLIGRTLSVTKRKSRNKDRVRGLTGRNSLDLGVSQGDLHAATLDSIRRIAKRDTWSRAEVTKNELGRRYEALARRKPTGEPTLSILDVVKLRHDTTNVHTPWLAWCCQHDFAHSTSIWTVTAGSVDEHLQASGRPPTRSSFASHSASISVGRSQSPSHSFSSRLSSPLSLLNSHQDVSRKDPRRIELTRSLSANPVIEGVASTSPPLSPIPSRSLSLTQSPSFQNLPAPPIGQRHSIDAVMRSSPAAVGFTNLTDSPRGSLDPGSAPLPSHPSKVEKDPLRNKFLLSLSGDRPSIELRTSTMPSLTNLFGTAHSSDAPSTRGRLHLGVGNMFGKLRRSGDEGVEGRSGRSRSSVSDDRDSGRDGEEIKSDDPSGPKGSGRGRTGSRFDLPLIRSRARDASNTSDSETGGTGGVPFTHRLAKRLRRLEKDLDGERGADDTTAELVRNSISGGEQREVDTLAAPGWTSRRGVRQARSSAHKTVKREDLHEAVRKREEEEQRFKEVYKAREVVLLEANDHNRRIARLLKAVGASIREHEEVLSELGQANSSEYTPIPHELLDAISADPATTLRHGKGWRAVEESHRRFNNQQALLASYLSTPMVAPKREDSPDLGDAIQEAQALWHDLQVKSQEIERQAAMVKPALEAAVGHMEGVQRKYNDTQILVETDYPEQTRIADLEMIITESRAPRGWLEFTAFWVPEHVLEFIGGFIRFFGVPISEKFIRPFLWYFFRNRYYWKIYSTEPRPSERAWYTRLGYWVVILSILAWYTTT